MLDVLNNINPEVTTPFIILSVLMSANYLGEIFPCRVQKLFSNNMYVKHILGILSLMFFVVLTRPNLYTSTNFIYVSLLFYGLFMFLSRLNYMVWFVVFGIFAIIYVLQIYLDRVESETQMNRNKIGDNTVTPDDEDKMPTHDISENIDTVITIQKYLFLLSIPITIVGFIHYLGEKKLEFGHNEFMYTRFFFGKPKCVKRNREYTGFTNTILHAFK
jgi:hypothetical protein